MKERTPSVCFAASSLKEGALPHGQPPSPREVASRSDDGRSSFLGIQKCAFHRFIQSRVETLIAKAIIQGRYAEGSTLTVDYDGNALVLK